MKLRNTILLALAIVCNTLSAQTTENYIETRKAKVPRTSALSTTNNEEQVIVSTRFFDGLGRPKQTVLRRASPNRKDIVRAIEYEDYGRQSRSYLPYEASFGENGTFRSDWKSRVKFFYHYADNSVADETNFFYSQNVFEPSPLNRIAQSYGPGSDWRVSGSEKPVTYGYRTNSTADTIQVITIDHATDQITSSGTSYDPEELWVTENTDENGNKMLEFKDKLGQVICKKSQLSATAYTSSYYVYDDFGNLRYVLPPACTEQMSSQQLSPVSMYSSDETSGVYAFELTGLYELEFIGGGYDYDINISVIDQVTNSVVYSYSEHISYGGGFTSDKFNLTAGSYRLEFTQSSTGEFTLLGAKSDLVLIDEFAFQYKYDGRKRMIEKKVPGAAPVYMVYDQRDRLVLTQDGNQRAKVLKH